MFLFYTLIFITSGWFHLSTFFYAFFLILVNVLILNLLIAMMTDILAQISSEKDLVCKVMRAMDCFAVENMIPNRVLKFMCPALSNYIVWDIKIKLPNGRFVTNTVYLINVRCYEENRWR